MDYGEIQRFQTGVAVPLFSLRSEKACGVGDLFDLVALAKWCAQVGLDLIQILPLNDTGRNSSPYSACSAFALNPIYIHLPAVEGSAAFVAEIAGACELYNAKSQIAYHEIYTFKLSLLRQIFNNRRAQISEDALFTTWCDDNPWVHGYVAYCVQKGVHDQRPWREWGRYLDPTPDDFDQIWRDHAEDCAFYAWVQYALEQQFRRVIKALNRLGVRLKGDIPILIDEDSADVWAERRFFDLRHRAGAPPDMFGELGQNWGFPCYNWEALEATDYEWWRRRLSQAAKFYHAYRIDHVLGFFRIWQVPEAEVTGVFGSFEPDVALSISALQKASGLTAEQLRQLAAPRVAGRALRGRMDAGALREIEPYLQPVADDAESVTLAPELGESAITRLDISEAARQALLAIYRDRVFLPAEGRKTALTPCWYGLQSGRFAALPEGARRGIGELVEQNQLKREALWEKTGRVRLKVMAEHADMLVCAEDLGVIPRCVPGVLESLAVYGLRVDRWTKHFSKAGEPYFTPAEFPRLSVVTTSTHDTSTLRGWWEELHLDRRAYFRFIGAVGECPEFLTTELTAAIIRRAFAANAAFCIIPLPDLFALHYDLRTETPEEERVNVPGAVSEGNWSWRMKISLEHLLEYDAFNAYVERLVAARAARTLSAA